MFFLIYLYLLLLWGLTPLLIQLSLNGAPFLTSLALRLFVAVIGVLLCLLYKRRWLPMHADALKVYFLISLNSLLALPLIYWATSQLATGLVAIGIATTPIFVAIVNRLSGVKLVISVNAVVACLFVLFGVLMVFYEGITSQSINYLALLAIAGYNTVVAISAVAIKKSRQDLSGFEIAGGSLFMALPGIGILALAVDGIPVLVIPMETWVVIFLLGTLSSLLAFTLYYQLIARVSLLYVAMIPVVTPIIAVVVGWVWLDERFNLAQVLGVLLVLLGISLLTLVKRHEKRLQIFNHDIKGNQAFSEINHTIDRYR